MTDEKPTINRMVHYVSYGTPGGEYQSTCRAAVITDVVSENPIPGDAFTNITTEHVCLAVFNPKGLFFDQWCAHDEETKRGGTWHWPERDD